VADAFCFLFVKFVEDSTWRALICGQMFYPC